MTLSFNECDHLVVGSGPGGSTAGRSVARAGLSVDRPKTRVALKGASRVLCHR
jgi:ribulose 1,5-bisphosphate synthetase/thiazole synthase